jgi:predicted DNA-binding antitoxin AbrB/MazE fold protein
VSTTIKAVYEDGVFKPKEGVSLEEHAEVDVVIPSRPVHDPDDPTGWKAIDELIGAGEATAPDVSERHDDYLYGDPDD